MKIDFSTVLLTLYGKPYMSKTDTGEVPLTLASAALEALLGPAQSPETGEQKFRAYQLAERVALGGEVDLIPEDVVLLKEKIGVHYLPGVVGAAYKQLNGT